MSTDGSQGSRGGGQKEDRKGLGGAGVREAVRQGGGEARRLSLFSGWNTE